MLGDKGVYRKSFLQRGYVSPTRAGHHDDVLVAERLDRRLHQQAQIGVVEGALGDVDDRSITVEFGPPRRQSDAARRRRMYCADVAHVGGQIATRVVELRDRRRGWRVARNPE
jgi:hypothetical protein